MEKSSTAGNEMKRRKKTTSNVTKRYHMPIYYFSKSIACHYWVRKVAVVTYFFLCKVDFKKKMTAIFYINQNLKKNRPMILRLFFLPSPMLFFLSYSPLINNYRLHTNMVPNRRKNMGRQKRVVIQMLDFKCPKLEGWSEYTENLGCKVFKY